MLELAARISMSAVATPAQVLAASQARNSLRTLIRKGAISHAVVAAANIRFEKLVSALAESEEASG